MKILAAVLILAASASATNAQTLYTVHAKALPAGAPTGNLVFVGHLYAISFDLSTRSATWCCYRATAADQAGRNQLERSWIRILPDQVLEPEDFEGSGYDLGHLAPLATFRGSAAAYETNAMVNVAPMTADLNRGPWARLEDQIRDLARSIDVDVAVGPLFEATWPELPAADKPHTVPSGFWAVIVAGDHGEAYAMPQSCGRRDAVETFRIPIDELERRCRLRFPAFPRKPGS